MLTWAVVHFIYLFLSEEGCISSFKRCTVWFRNCFQCRDGARLSQTTNTAAAYVTCVINLWQTSYFPGSATLTDERFRRSITFDSWITSAFRGDHRAAPHWQEECFRRPVTFDSFHFQRRSPQGFSWCAHRIITRLSYTLSERCLGIGFLWSQLFCAIKRKTAICSLLLILVKS